MKQIARPLAAALLALAAMAGPVPAQQVAFGGLSHDSSLPVEISADQLQVDQSNGAATFTGNVEIAQGEMRLTAGAVRVIYAQGDDGRISRLEAEDGVTLVSGAEAAESRQAVYDIDAGTVVMTGDVILTQGPNALSSNEMTIDLNAGTGTMQGRVRSVFGGGSGD